MTILQLLAAAVIGSVLFGGVRWIGRQSQAVQAIVAAGLVARAAIGVTLFWISYLQLPVLRSLQLGGGFWSPTLDARGYFRAASAAVDQGLSTITPESVSPFFVKTLAVWMHMVGTTPSAGMLLNLCLYIGCCVIVTRLYGPIDRWRSDLPLLIAVGSISFSPVLLIDSTQALKDDLFLALIVVVCASVMLTFRFLAGSAPNRRRGLAGSVLVFAGAIYAIAGIRPYYPVIVCVSLVVTFTALALTSPRGKRLHKALAGLLVLGVVQYAYWTGAGPYYRPSEDERRRVAESLRWDRGVQGLIELLLAPASALTKARTAFVVAGGDTNIASGQASSLALVGIGVAVIVVPISILQATSVVSFAGGRGLLPIADADVLFMDCSLIGLGIAVFRRRRLIGDERAFVCFGLALAIVTAVLLGYVVTNVGTLFRMRYLVATPVWMMALAVAPRPSESRGPTTLPELDRA